MFSSLINGLHFLLNKIFEILLPVIGMHKRSWYLKFDMIENNRKTHFLTNLHKITFIERIILRNFVFIHLCLKRLLSWRIFDSKIFVRVSNSRKNQFEPARDYSRFSFPCTTRSQSHR